MYFGKKLSLYFKRMRRRNIKNRVSGWMALGTLNNLITYKNAFMQLYSWSLRSLFFFLIQLPYFYSLKPLSSQSSHPQGYYVKFSMTVQLTSARKMKFVRFFLNFFANDLRNFFATFWLHFYVKCKVYHKN